MPRMKTHHDRDAHRVVIGPCPGCDIWTLEYDTDLVLTKLCSCAWSGRGAHHTTECPVVRAHYLPAEFNALVESILAEHLQECSGLREVVDTL